MPDPPVSKIEVAAIVLVLALLASVMAAAFMAGAVYDAPYVERSQQE